MENNQSFNNCRLAEKQRKRAAEYCKRSENNEPHKGVKDPI